MKVPFVNFAAAYDELRAELDEAYSRCMKSHWYVMGEELSAFGAEYAAYCGTKYCVGVGNGLDAMHLVLRAWGIGDGDEVIVPSNTYIATWLAVSYAGARPVPVEPDRASCTIDPHRIADAISPQTRAIIPVHLYGQTADVVTIRAMAAGRGLKVLEDAAQSHGARCREAASGALGDAAAHSFYPTKNLGGFGDGGAVTTDDPQLADAIRALRNYGARQRYSHEIQGFNSRLDELQAALLRVKLRHLDRWNEQRAMAAQHYLRELAPLDDRDIILPKVQQGMTPVWHLFVVQSRQRNELQHFLTANGISTLIHYPIPPHLAGAYKALGYVKGDFPIAEQLAESILSLPIGPHIGKDAIAYVVNSIRQFVGGKRA